MYTALLDFWTLKTFIRCCICNPRFHIIQGMKFWRMDSSFACTGEGDGVTLVPGEQSSSTHALAWERLIQKPQPTKLKSTFQSNESEEIYKKFR